MGCFYVCKKLTNERAKLPGSLITGLMYLQILLCKAQWRNQHRLGLGQLPKAPKPLWSLGGFQETHFLQYFVKSD